MASIKGKFGLIGVAALTVLAACEGKPPEEVAHCREAVQVLLEEPPVFEETAQALQKQGTEITVDLEFDTISAREVPTSGSIRCQYPTVARLAGEPLQATTILLDGRPILDRRLLEINALVDATQFRKSLKEKTSFLRGKDDS